MKRQLFVTMMGGAVMLGIALVLLIIVNFNGVANAQISSIYSTPLENLSLTPTHTATAGSDKNNNTVCHGEDSVVCAAEISAKSAIETSDKSYDASTNASHEAFLGAIVTGIFSIVVVIVGTIITAKTSTPASEIKREIQLVKQAFEAQQMPLSVLQAIKRYELHSRQSFLKDLHAKNLPFIPLHLSSESSTLQTSELLCDPIALIHKEQRWLEQCLYKNSLDIDIDSNIRIEALTSYSGKSIPQRQLLILGNPGTGKTTLLKCLALQNLEQNSGRIFPTPIYIELKEFAHYLEKALPDEQDAIDKMPTNILFNYVTDYWIREYGYPNVINPQQNVTPSYYLEQEASNGRIMFLLDGLNKNEMSEVSGKALERYRQVIRSIEYIRRNYSGIYIIVTARKTQYEPTKAAYPDCEVKDFQPWYIEDLCPEDIELFVERWATNNNAVDSHFIKELVSIFDVHPRLQALAANPHLLCFIAKYYLDFPELSRHRTHLCELCIQNLLPNENFAKKPNFSEADYWRLLNAIAWHIHHQYMYKFKIANVSSVFSLLGDTPDKWKTCLDELVQNTSIFKTYEDETISFSSITIQELFVAKNYILETSRTGTQVDLNNHLQDLWWEEVIVHCITLKADDNQLLSLLQEASNNHVNQDGFYTGLLSKIRTLPPDFQTFLPYENFTSIRDAASKAIRKQVFENLLLAEYQFAQEKIYRTSFEIESQKITKNYITQLLQIQSSIASSNGDFKNFKQNMTLLEDNYSFCPALLLLLNYASFDQTILQIFIDLTRGNDLKQKSLQVRLLFSPDRPLEQRIYFANVIGLLGEQSLAPFLLDLLKQGVNIEPELGWAIGYAIGMLGKRSNEIVKDLLLLLGDDNRNLHIRWSAANTLHILGMLGKRLVAIELKTFLINFCNSFTDKDNNLDEYYLLLNIISVLGDLGALDNGTKSLIRSSVLSSRASETILAAIKLLLEEKPDITVVDELIDMLNNSTLGILERVRIAEILQKIANTKGTLDKLSVLQSNLTSEKDILTESLYQARWVINYKMSNIKPNKAMIA